MLEILNNINFVILVLAVLVVGFLGMTIGGAVARQWFMKFVNKKFDDIYIRQENNEREREKDYYISIYGQRVICDCLHELNYAVLNGTHNGELEKTNDDLNEYRKLLNKTVDEKAAKWNSQLG